MARKGDLSWKNLTVLRTSHGLQEDLSHPQSRTAKQRFCQNKQETKVRILFPDFHVSCIVK